MADIPLDYSRKRKPYDTVRAIEVGGDSNRILPRQVSTGSTRGTQTVGYGSTKIDGTNNTITMVEGSILITGIDKSVVGIGKIPGEADEQGFFSLDENGKLIMKIVNGTKYVYDPANNYVNVTQDGLLPDGTGGFVAAKPGISVDELFT